MDCASHYINVNGYIHNNISAFIERKNPVIIEAGTCTGEETLYYSELYPEGKIYGFEPNMKQFNLAKELMEKNNRTNVELFNYALSDRTGDTLELYVSDRFNAEWGSSSILKPKLHLDIHPDITFKETMKSRTINLDDFIRDKNIDYVDCIELDLQGYEPFVLMSSPLTLKKTKILFTEINTIELYEGIILYPEFKEFMIKNNFEILRESNMGAQGDVIFANKAFAFIN